MQCRFAKAKRRGQARGMRLVRRWGLRTELATARREDELLHGAPLRETEDRNGRATKIYQRRTHRKRWPGVPKYTCRQRPKAVGNESASVWHTLRSFLSSASGEYSPIIVYQIIPRLSSFEVIWNKNVTFSGQVERIRQMASASRGKAPCSPYIRRPPRPSRPRRSHPPLDNAFRARG